MFGISKVNDFFNFWLLINIVKNMFFFTKKALIFHIFELKLFLSLCLSYKEE